MTDYSGVGTGSVPDDDDEVSLDRLIIYDQVR